MNKKTIIILVLILAAAIAAYFFFFRKKCNCTGQPGCECDGTTADGTQLATATANPSINYPDNSLLSGFDEGESLRHNGQLFEVVNGAWAWMGAA
jgi:flagellar basal body-associated protein FliL